MEDKGRQPPKLDYHGPSARRARPLTRTPRWMRWMDLAQIVLLCLAALILLLGLRILRFGW
jgi:hypothetical protein